jgi:NAD(P)-dependent dehydrogenase (short-subunit alcohol dehydrogenase family)
MPATLITGANQGLGLEMVRQYAADGWEVIACCRNPRNASELQDISKSNSKVRVEALDLNDPTGIDALAARLGDTAIDLLLNNAGIMGALPFRENLHRQHFGTLDYELWDQVLRTNTLGTLKVTEAFVEHVARSDQRKIVSLSSTTASIAGSDRQALAYTTSKTALNKAMTLVAKQLEPRGIIVTLVCPGYVKTRMNVGGATLEIPESVAGLRQLIAGLTLDDTGTFRRYDGAVIPW